MSGNDNKIIKFIDSDYRELFKIPDGGNINIIYPPGDYRGILTRKCEFLDEYHTKIGMNIYHICEFAERMEAIGARYEPEAQLHNAEILPFTAGEEKFYTYNREEGNSCAGHVAGDFGSSGDRFHGGWYNHKTKTESDWSGSTPEFQAELHSAVYALRQSVLKDYGTMMEYCQSHPEAKLPDTGGYNIYGFKLETDTRQYYVRCFAESDARFVVYAYDNAAPELSQEQTGEEKPSVIKQIRDSEKTPKPPRKPKSPEKNKDGEAI
jgi:hypothetical protein